MNSHDRKVLRRFRALLEEQVNLHALILFGSRARGDAEPDSDMDVVVVLGESSPRAERIASECAWQAGIENGVLVVPIVYSREEWEKGPERSSLLALAVEQDGIPA
jgi:phosphopantetheine adenylyltransferase